MAVSGLQLRSARADDYEDVAAFTRDTWSDRGGSDYIPDVYHDWIEGEDSRTLVVDRDGAVAGIAQCTLLSEDEAWCQGMRVDPEFRGQGVSARLTEGLFDWAAERGATVARNMVYSWNVAGLGQSRATGFEPSTEFRWAQPEPDSDASPDLPISDDPAVAWRAWADSDAREHLNGLALDRSESWAVSELTRADLRAAADETAVFAVVDDGARGMAYRVRDYERESNGETERRVEYGVGAWDDVDAAGALFDAIAADAASLGADRTRVLVPETVEHVSDVAATRTAVSDEPDFVLAADLTDR